MKKCSYCGKEYPDKAVECAIDREPLSPPGPQPVQADPSWHPRFIDLATIGGAFTCEEGFSRPDWKCIRSAIQRTVSREWWFSAWNEAALQWVEELRADLGGDYRVDWSARVEK